METITNSLKEVLFGTWPMIALTCVVLISIRLAYLLKNKQKFVFSNEIMMLTFIIYILCLFQIVTNQDVSGVHGVNVTLFKELTRYIDRSLLRRLQLRTPHPHASADGVRPFGRQLQHRGRHRGLQRAGLCRQGASPPARPGARLVPSRFRQMAFRPIDW